MEMHIHIFWDALAPEGFQMPVARNIAAIIGTGVTVAENHVRLTGYSDSRKQLDAAALLDSATAYRRRHRISDPVLIVIDQDLYSPGHSFVFGLARQEARVAVVSSARLKNEYYNLVRNDDDLTDRLTKEGAHETGHLLGLSHCTDPECIMFRPDTLAELDGKKKIFCSACREKLDQYLAGQEE
jgi:archaemetzincin